jgi:hypothetical protein
MVPTSPLYVVPSSFQPMTPTTSNPPARPQGRQSVTHPVSFGSGVARTPFLCAGLLGVFFSVEGASAIGSWLGR